MLVLTRRIGEEIIINGTIRVSVLDVGPSRVRLGVMAPASIPVTRQEVHSQHAAMSLTSPLTKHGQDG